MKLAAVVLVFKEAPFLNPKTNTRHYIHKDVLLYEELQKIPTKDLPKEIKDHVWPEGWIER